jgi:hypothetical protein
VRAGGGLVLREGRAGARGQRGGEKVAMRVREAFMQSPDCGN